MAIAAAMGVPGRRCSRDSPPRRRPPLSRRASSREAISEKQWESGVGEERLPPLDRDPSTASRPSGAAKRLRRVLGGRRARILLWIVASFAILIGAAAALAPWLYSPAAAKSAISAQLQNAAGLYIAARGYPRLSLTPRPHVTLEGVVFADRNGALVIEAQQIHGVLKLLPLLSGRLDIDGLALVRPRARIDLDQKPIDAPGAAARAAAAKPASLEAQAADNFRLGVLTITDGSLRVRRGGVDYAADKIDGALEWRKIGEPALLTGAFDWRGERLQLMAWLARPGSFLRGDPSVATARLDGENLRIEAQGVAQTLPNAHYAGRVAGSAASVREALRLFGVNVPLPGPFGAAQFSAHAALSAREAALKELHVDVDGNAFDGELIVRDEDGRPNVSAALKSDFVALKPMLSDAPALLGPDGQWSREPLDPPDMSGADVDLHLSAAHARLGRLTIDEATFAATLRDGALDLSLVEAQAYRGRLKAHASFKPASGGALAVHATAQTAGVDARALLWDAFGKQAIGGALTSSLTLDASGGAVADMMKSLGGRATLALADGEIAGVDFERALRRLEKRPLSSAQDIRSGSSPLARAGATVIVENGVGTLEEALAYGPGFVLSLKGSANLAERSLALKAAAREADASGKPREKGLQIAFDLAGAWDDLTLAPDPQAFIRRSGAAAPLLPEPPDPPATEPP
ncbi:AsmA family protein [Methylocystis sp. JAN1]|uniref:AsmA family protein n=1 Tax=Methylocystis sp. JAN1 TaxID=3397211 RepID=UPI003FA2CFD3